METKELHTRLLLKKPTTSATKNIRVASSDKLVITFKFDSDAHISTMIPT